MLLCGLVAAAEAWALKVVLSECPFPPAMRTDCLSLLRTAEQESQRATSAKKQLARIWVAISAYLDGMLSTLTNEGLLVWMPAHQALNMVGEAKRSDLKRLTVVDWRANRLVDALAKSEAKRRELPLAVEKLLNSACLAVKHCAVHLGRVTHAANNFVTFVPGPDGEPVRKVLRDATQAPRTYKRKAIGQPAEPPAAKKLVRPCTAKAWEPPRGPKKRQGPDTLHIARARKQELARTSLRVQEIGASLRPAARPLTAAARREAVERRVRAKLALHDTSGKRAVPGSL